MEKRITKIKIGEVTFYGVEFDVYAIPSRLYMKMIEAAELQSPLKIVEVANDICNECLKPKDGSPFDFSEIPPMELNQLAKLTVAYERDGEEAKISFTRPPEKSVASGSTGGATGTSPKASSGS